MNHRAKQDIDFFLLPENQLTVVAAHALYRVTAIDRAASLAILPSLLLRGIGTENDIFRGNTQFSQKAYPELVGRPDVEDFRDADTQLRAILGLATTPRCCAVRSKPSCRTMSAIFG